MNKVNFDINSLIRPNVAKMKPYSSARDEFKDFDSEMIFLDANENPFETNVNRYPDPKQQKLKSILSKQKNIPSNQILLGNGSDEVLDLIFRAFCEPSKDNIITLPPTYGMYSVLANLNNIENREVLLDSDFQPDLVEISRTTDTHTKLLFICSPNNPTGNLITSEKILKLLKTFNGLIVIDEAYIDFAKEESWTTKLNEFPNLIVTQTLSKAYGLAGIRLGICYSSTEIIAVLNKIKPPYNINKLTQQFAIERLEDTKKTEGYIALLNEERGNLLKVLVQVNFIEKVYPTDANFILIKVDNAEKRYSQLLQKDIVVRNRSSQSLCENTLRITIGTTSENKKLITILKTLK
ncbi:histidinol-phosphate transaminase [Aequorivita antarctica]|uniref:Histidinol-phosphate aminotransferase n=1 Tax=Aequorivita antarctica TaxID=153266 RepID=A0A5C6Z2T7_9FLAO|nr:histidinol-phosphate transaminase [Aequorivita antarctica]TXD74467.1 histidinol-phosphate transaminase [Aequorivita antarctica]SRX73826.1 Histidinol-phosphate aminotransferase [Aequorivita antarctica]